MAGEMGHIDRETGIDDSGNVWNLHSCVAVALDAELRPFDQYQGPYIKVDRFKIWIQAIDDFEGRVTLEPISGGEVKSSEPFVMHSPGAESLVVELALGLLATDVGWAIHDYSARSPSTHPYRVYHRETCRVTSHKTLVVAQANCKANLGDVLCQWHDERWSIWTPAGLF